MLFTIVPLLCILHHIVLHPIFPSLFYTHIHLCTFFFFFNSVFFFFMFYILVFNKYCHWKHWFMLYNY
ncbi:hypothetical protein BC941DRAFT_419430 [Chlamydoabsidia padenii]|nr:hypothetical protein BC941DRAFT_419430 [Chlamydoabsidia padenii]